MADINKLLADLQNLDIPKLKKIFLQYQNLVIKILLVIASLATAVMIFNDAHTRQQALEKKISQAKDKLGVITSREKSVQGLNAFLSALPDKLNQFTLITLISQVAKLYNVSYSSLSPSEAKDMGLYDVINVNFSAQAGSFKDMMLFMRYIERTKYHLRIDTWSGSETEDGKINFTILISAVNIHS